MWYVQQYKQIHGLELSDRVEKSWNLDVVGAIHTSDSGNSYILSVMDTLSSFAFFFAMPDMKAATVAENLLTVVAFLGCPETVISDQGSQLIGSDLTR